jgi:hypothetical protein
LTIYFEYEIILPFLTQSKLNNKRNQLHNPDLFSHKFSDKIIYDFCFSRASYENESDYFESDEDDDDDDDLDDSDDSEDEEDEEEEEEEESSDNEEATAAAEDGTRDETSTKTTAHRILRQTQERLIDDVFMYLLGTDDAKLRLETARSLTRLVANMNMLSVFATANQNMLLAAGESALKSHGFAINALNASLVDSDLFNLTALKSSYFHQPDSGPASSNSTSTSSLAPTSILHGGGGHNPKKQIRYTCSPLNSLTLNSSLAWLSKSTLNNTFVQPFHALIKHWPSATSTSATVNNNLNRVIEHNLAYVVQLLVKHLADAVDKSQFLGYLESLDFLFQVNSIPKLNSEKSKREIEKSCLDFLQVVFLTLRSLF